MPMPSSRQIPELKVVHSPTAESPGLAMQISGVGRDGNSTDYVVWSPRIADHALTFVDCRACAVWSRSGGQREDARFIACNVQECRSNQEDQIQFVSQSQPVAWVRWDPEHGLVSGAERFE